MRKATADLTEEILTIVRAKRESVTAALAAKDAQLAEQAGDAAKLAARRANDERGHANLEKIKEEAAAIGVAQESLDERQRELA